MMAKMIASEALEPSIPTVVAGPDTDGSSHAAFDGAADTDGRDDLNCMPDCEGESKADSDGRYQPSWTEQKPSSLPRQRAIKTRKINRNSNNMTYREQLR